MSRGVPYLLSFLFWDLFNLYNAMFVHRKTVTQVPTQLVIKITCGRVDSEQPPGIELRRHFFMEYCVELDTKQMKQLDN